jgi:glycosyltransferase involved in cell wall biosynthesis
MHNQRFLLVGHLPPPITGQSEAFEMLIDHFKSAHFVYDLVDIGSHKKERRVGNFSLIRFFEILKAGFTFFQKLMQVDVKVMYLSLSISRMGFLKDFFFIWMASFRKLTIVLQLHGGGYKGFYLSQNQVIKSLISRALSQAANIIVLSSGLIEEFDFLPNFHEKIKVIHNTSKIGENALGLKKKFLSYPFRILYMSNLIKTKGFLDLLEASKYLKKLNVEILFCGKFIQIGDEEGLQEEFFSKIEDKETYGEIRYMGVVSGKQKREILNSAHVFVLPTYYQFEGQPISIIEALAFGLPIISTKYRSIKEMVVNNSNGFFVEPRSPIQIAEKINTLYQNRDLCKQMGQQSIKIYQKNFSKKINRELNLELFKELAFSEE